MASATVSEHRYLETTQAFRGLVEFSRGGAGFLRGPSKVEVFLASTSATKASGRFSELLLCASDATLPGGKHMQMKALNEHMCVHQAFH